MPKFFPQVFITGIVLLLLLGAGYGISQAARAIPWDCTDWQAFAHSDRTTSILESLAANRGKTLYCAIDQSDTFTKAETWEAGRDRNERDDTVYQGEQGRFRGFIAAQEGWLTEGESGVTGQSIDRIFEFPREEKKRRRRTVRPNLVYGREYPTSTLPVPSVTANADRDTPPGPAGPTTGYLLFNELTTGYPFLRSPRSAAPNINFPGNGYVRALGPAGDSGTSATAAQASALAGYVAPSNAQAKEWALNGSGTQVAAERGFLEALGGATQECQSLDPERGYTRATIVRWWYQDADGNGEPDLFYTTSLVNTPNYQYKAYRVILYTARCR